MSIQRHTDKIANMDKFVVRLPDGLRDELKQVATQEFMSMNSFVLKAIANEIKRVKK